MSQGFIKKPQGLVRSASGRWGSAIGNPLPTDITGLKIWLEGDYGITMDPDDYEVNQWVDRQGYCIFTQTLTKRPLWVASVDLANNQAGVQFDGVDDHMASDFTDIAQPFTIILLATEPTGITVERFMFCSSTGNAEYLAQFRDTYVYKTKFGTALSIGATVTGNPLARWRLQYTGTGSLFFKNGVQTAAATAGTGALTSMCLAAYYVGSYPGNITIFSLIVYNKILSESEVSILNSYLTSKFGAGV